MGDQIQLLYSKRFLPLFVTQFLGAFNDNAFRNAFLIWFTYHASTQSTVSTPVMRLAFFQVGPASWFILASLLTLAICGGIYSVPLYTLMQ